MTGRDGMRKPQCVRHAGRDCGARGAAPRCTRDGASRGALCSCWHGHTPALPAAPVLSTAVAIGLHGVSWHLGPGHFTGSHVQCCKKCKSLGNRSLCTQTAVPVRPPDVSCNQPTFREMECCSILISNKFNILLFSLTFRFISQLTNS